MFDLVVRNATVYDGSGMPPYRGDVGVKGGRIVRVGRICESGDTEVDAAGLAVAPGFVDIHTHYDAQLCWDGLAQPALEHGVTTVVTGNCSLTLAPLRAAQRDRLCRMFRQIEDLPMAAFDDGINWTWETFDGWLDSLRGTLGLNIAPLVGHSALRMWVMGEDAFHREATTAEVAEMQGLLRGALGAGASGMSTSYIDVDDSWRPVPSRLATHDELRALCATLGEAGSGILQVVHEFYDTALTLQRIDTLAELSLEFGIPTTLSPLFEAANTPEMVPAVLARLAEHRARGARVWPQVQTRPIDINFRLRERNFMLMTLPSWFAVFNLPTTEDRLAAYLDPQTRAKLVAEAYPAGDEPVAVSMRARMGNSYVRGVADPANAGLVGMSLNELGAARGVNPVEAMIDLAVSEELDTEFKNDGLGHTDRTKVGELLADPAVLIGASDGGAHVQAFATNGDTGYLFATFVRGTGSMTTEQAVRRVTHEPALAWGLADRGLLHPGYAADLVVFDPATIDRDEEIGVSDLPGDGFRYIRRGKGVHTVIVNGQITWTAADGYTAARAGEVVSHMVPG
ncbi:MAG: amidohydrolase family protein [Ilumatobacteraceae bacterium]